MHLDGAVFHVLSLEEGIPLIDVGVGGKAAVSSSCAVASLDCEGDMRERTGKGNAELGSSGSSNEIVDGGITLGWVVESVGDINRNDTRSFLILSVIALNRRGGIRTSVPSKCPVAAGQELRSGIDEVTEATEYIPYGFTERERGDKWDVNHIRKHFILLIRSYTSVI